MESELSHYFRILRKRALLIVATLIASIAVSVALTLRAIPIYQASAKLFVGQRQVSTAEITKGQTVIDLSAKLLQSYAEIIKTYPIAAIARRQASLPQSPFEISRALSANPILDTQIILVSYRSSDPRLAERTVNAISSAFESEIQKIETQPMSEGSEPAVKVAVVEPAVRPSTPVEPQPSRNYGVGLAIGIALGVALALLVDQFDMRVKRKQDVESLGVPVLASIPKIQTRREELYLEGDNQSVFAETFRKLRTAIQLYAAETEHRRILVTSPRAKEGKSTAALNLAAVYAYSGSRTILVEADLRRPKLHEHFANNDLNGLTLALLGRNTLEAAILATSIPNLSCIPAGAIPPNPAELLSSKSMQTILAELHGRYDVIIVDAPPLLPVADAATLAPRVDGVLIVARVKQTPRGDLKESLDLVRAVGGKVLGVALNASPMSASGNEYSYYDAEMRARSRRKFARN